MGIEDMLAGDLREWETLCSILDSHPDGVVHGDAKDSWDSRDIYAHLARWLRYSNDNLEKIRAGQPVRLVDGNRVDEINRQWRQEDRNLTLTEAREAAQRELNRRILLVGSMPGDFLQAGNRKTFSIEGAVHFEVHRRYITG